MQFTEFRLINFGPYAGEHRLDVRVEAHHGLTERPIILIGGSNGAGKTTILEAVRLALYGPAALGQRTKRTNYEEYLQSRMHRPPGSPFLHTFAGVGVGFIQTIGSASHEFHVLRMWERHRDRVRETVQITKDGVPLNEQDRNWWDQFVANLLPPSLADLFFFDGEQIQALADENHNTVLGEAIQSLLGLDLLQRLRADLAVYLARQRRTGQPGLEAQLADLRSRRQAVEAAFQQADTELGQLNSLIEQCRSNMTEAEQRLAREGGTLVAQRDRLNQRANDLRELLRRYERQIAEHANGLLPFAIAPHLAHALKDRLERDEQVEQYQRVAEVADSFLSTLTRHLNDTSAVFAGIALDAYAQRQIVERLSNTARAIRDQLVPAVDPTLATDTVVHPLTNEQRQRLIQWLDQALTTTPAQLAELGQAYEQAAAELTTIEATLLSLPADDHLQPLLQQLLHLQRELADLESKHRAQETLVHQLRQQRASLDREESELYTRLMRGDDPNYRIHLAIRAQRVAMRYEEALRQAKIKELEAAVVDCFGQLSHKGPYIHRITIDPDTFAATLYTAKGDAVPREQLSAGEKQLYAVALLWALRLVSGRTVPIIIDTPLGRLDSEHRQRIVQRYLPRASHQVIILSTDTEIDRERYADLEPLIARSYRLVYHRGEASTQIQPGYFWSTYEHDTHGEGVPAPR